MFKSLLSVLFFLIICGASVLSFNYDNEYCVGFMSLVAGKSLYDDDCSQSILQLDERMQLMSSQMEWINSTIFIFSAFSNETGRLCEWNLPYLKVVNFNATKLLLEYGFGEFLPEIQSWSLIGPNEKSPKHQYARLSDILRVLLAHKYQYTYLDYDVYYLNSDPKRYLKPHVGAAAWSSEKHYLEISNSAFCLPLPVLEDMLAFIKKRIRSGGESYFYTELGPNMFHRVIYNKYPILMYTQNHPRLIEVSHIAADVLNYHHEMLHMTGLLRGNQVARLGLNLPTFLLKIRESLKLPPLNHRVETKERAVAADSVSFRTTSPRTSYSPQFHILMKFLVISIVIYVWIKLKMLDRKIGYKIAFVVFFAYFLFQ